MTTAVMAAELSYEGEVAVKWNNDPALDDDNTGFAEDSLEAKVVFDYEKDFGDGVTAGVKTKMEAHEDEKFEFDGGGWIKVDYDLFAVKAATKIKDEVGKDFVEFEIGEAAGVEVVVVPVEDFTLTAIVNDGMANGYRLLAKGEYAADIFSVGGGYQTERSGAMDGDDHLAKTALGVYGSFDAMENLTIKGEFGSRNFGLVADEDAITAILANVKYDDGVIMADASYLMVDEGFDILDYD